MFGKKYKAEAQQLRERFQLLDSETRELCSAVCDLAFDHFIVCICIGLFLGFFICDFVDVIFDAIKFFS